MHIRAVRVAVTILTTLPSWQAHAQESADLRERMRAIARSAEERRLPVSAAAGQVRSLEAAAVHRLAFDLAASERGYRELLANASPAVRAHASLGLGNLFSQSARYGDAAAWFDSSARQFFSIHDSAGLAESWFGKSQALLRTSGIPAARASLSIARRYAPVSDTWIRGFIACGSMLVRVRAANRMNAREILALRMEGHASSARAEALCLLAQVEQLEGQGAVTAALATIDTLAALQERAHLLSGLSATRQWQGWLLSTRGDYLAARAALDEAVRLGVETGTLSSAGWANSALAEIARRLGSWTDGARYAMRAEQAFTQARDEPGLASARLQAAQAALAAGDLPRASGLFSSVQPRILALFPRSAAELLAARSDIARVQGNQRLATVLLDSATLRAREFGQMGFINDLTYRRGILALNSGDLESAQRILSTLLSRTTLTSPLLRYQSLARLGEAEARAGNVPGARASLEQALGELDRWRAHLEDRALRLAAAQTLGFDSDPGLGIATIVASIAREDPSSALVLADARRARALDVQSAWRGMLSPDAVRQGSVEKRLVANAPRSVDEGTAILSYTTGTGVEPMTIFLTTRHGTSARVAMPVDSLAPVIRRFVAFLEGGHLARPAARRLAAVLIDPVLPLLPGSVTRLVIVPDGVLHRVPFDALALPGGALLAERFELVTSLSVSMASRGRGPPPVTSQLSPRRAVVAFGAPANDSTGDAGAWPALPGALAEMRRVRGIVSGTEVTTGAAATFPALRAASAPGGAVLHLAMHAQANENSLMTGALRFAPTVGHSGETTSSDVAAAYLPFDLVVLSACESGNGSLFSGEGLHGLATAFLEAGAHSVLATRWRLEDHQSSEFVSAFYRSMVAGRDAAAAVAEARREAIGRGESPEVWANYELIGEPLVAPKVEGTTNRFRFAVLMGVLCVALGVYGMRVFTTRMTL